MRLFLAVSCLLAVACSASVTTRPSAAGPLRPTASITVSVIPAGDTATIVFRLQNVGSDTVTLHFSDSCQLNPYVSSSFGLIVYPPGGGWVCATALTSLTLRPGESTTQELKVGGMGLSLNSYVPLGAGDYSAYARVPSSEYTLQSEPVRFTVR